MAISDAWRLGFRPFSDSQSIVEWVEANVVLPGAVFTEPGPVDLSHTRHFIPILNKLADDVTREVNVMAPVRSGKTLMADVWLPWIVANRPGPYLQVMQIGSMAKEHCEGRTWQILDLCKALDDLRPVDRTKRRNTDGIFRNGMQFWFKGPAFSGLQSKGVCYVVLDEPWLYSPGVIAQAKGRQDDFRRHGRSKLLALSQAGGKRCDEWSTQFASGSLLEWRVPCDGCNELMTISWSGLRKDGTRFGITYETATLANGYRCEDTAARTVRFVCEHCGHRHEDGHRLKARWNAGGKYIGDDTKPNLSYHFTGIINTPWVDLVREWVRAKNIEDFSGDSSAIASFLEKKMAENPARRADEDFIIPSISTEISESGVPTWDKTAVKVMAVDVQHASRWVLVMALSRDGEDMVLYADEVSGWEEVEAVKDRFGVSARGLAVDCAQWPQRVYAGCIALGDRIKINERRAADIYGGMPKDQRPDFEILPANAFRGSPWGEFVHKTKKGKKVRLPYTATAEVIDPKVGYKRSDMAKMSEAAQLCKIRRYVWSNLYFKDIAEARLGMMRDGRMSYVHESVDQARLLRHLTAEHRVSKATAGPSRAIWELKPGRKDNHLLDCYCMCLVMGVMAGFIQIGKTE